MRLRGKLISAFLVVSLLVLAAGIAGMYSGNRIYNEASEVIEGLMPIKDASMEGIISLQTSIDSSSEYILKTENIDSIEQKIEHSLDMFHMWIRAIKLGTESREFRGSSSGELYRSSGVDVVIPHGGSQEVASFTDRAEGSYEKLSRHIDGLFSVHRNRIRYNFEYEGAQWNIVDFLHLVELQHVRWIEDLQESSAADEQFTGQTDFTQCFFGRWFYNYTIEDQQLNALLDSLEPHHKALHNAAIEINNSPGSETKLALYTANVVPTAQSIEDMFNEIHEYVDPLMDELIDQENAVLSSLSAEASLAQESLEGLEMQVDSEVNTGVQEASDTRNSSLYFLIAAIVLGVVLALVIGIIMASRISRPLRRITDKAESMADGIFSIEKLDITSKDETGDLAAAFARMTDSIRAKVGAIENIAAGDLTTMVEMSSDKDELGSNLVRMRDSLNTLLGQVNNAVDQVNSGADQIAQSSQDLSQGATEQASSLEEVTSSINQVNSQSKQNAENAGEAHGLAKRATEDAEKGNLQMKQLNESMEKINASSDEINKVVKVIDDIAFQINLLALNANVEAARAGKYGKGFVVVADEVRNLAVKSTDSVKETGRMVEDTVSNIKQGTEAAEATAKQLSSIVEGSGKVADFLEEIAQSSREQAQAVEQITEGLDQIDEATQASTASAEQSASASEELAGQAQQLHGMVSKFKLTQNLLIEENTSREE